MALVSVQNVSLTLSGPKLLDAVNLQIAEGQRVCLLGRNGTGKSSFLKVINGDLPCDSGSIVRQQGVTVAMLAQEVPQHISGVVYSVVASGLGDVGDALATHFEAGVRLAQGETSEELMSAMLDAQQFLDSKGGWEAHQIVQSVINHLKLSPEAEFSTLSGGVKRRCLLGRALACQPDVLLLDEPTNHLDVESIAWLEEFLLRYIRTLVMVTHDRLFLRKIANRIVELDRGNLADWQCDYDTFLSRKEELLHAEEKEWARFDQKLAEEEVWVRKGLKARRTRNMGRVRALQDMREERKKRRERFGSVSMRVQEAERSGKLVLEAKDISYAYPDSGKAVVTGFSAAISRGDKVGLIGPNGIGKTTLLRLLLGHLEPTAGVVRHGTRLEVSYFDQLRNSLDENASVRDNIAEGNDTVEIAGNRRHVVGYLKDFLFDPERMRMPVHSLSGGERNRLLLAKLFTIPSNVLVMDEPTNDLDVETLELLENLLVEYAGTLLLVSHDRAFLNNVVTSTIAFEEGGRIAEYVGGYDDWLRQRPEISEVDVVPEKPVEEEHEGTEVSAGFSQARKLSYNEQRELTALQEELADLPEKLEALDEEQAMLEKKLADPKLYTTSPEEFSRTSDRLAGIASEQEAMLERWEVVEARVEELSQYRS